MSGRSVYIPNISVKVHQLRWSAAFSERSICQLSSEHVTHIQQWAYRGAILAINKSPKKARIRSGDAVGIVVTVRSV